MRNKETTFRTKWSYILSGAVDRFGEKVLNSDGWSCYNNLYSSATADVGVALSAGFHVRHTRGCAICTYSTGIDNSTFSTASAFTHAIGRCL
jgi:hypothetical protein